MSGSHPLGVRPIVNAKGPATRLSGPPICAEVAAAMAAVAGSCFDIVELQAAAGAVIVEATGAEAGLVTSGAAAGLLLATAACVARGDPAAMARLPEIGGLKDEVVVARSQRNQYDHAVRTVGVRLVEAGLPDRVAGAGVRDTEAWEIAAAISPRTAAVLWVAGPGACPPLAATVQVAHAAGLPVIVDAAAQLPPRANLRAFTAAGADLVAFSGGKAIGGPQASGILCGRRELVASAALQMLDMDYLEGTFPSTAGPIDPNTLNGLPPHGIGRPCKVGREQIVGLATALQLYRAGDDAMERAIWLERLTEIAATIGERAGLSLRIDDAGAIPRLVIAVDASRAQIDARALYDRLRGSEPRIETDPAQLWAGRLVLDPTCLIDGDAERIGKGLEAALGG